MRSVTVKLLLLCAFFVTSVVCVAQTTKEPESPLAKEADAVYPKIEPLYIDIHEHPELSGHEVQTAAKMAARLRALGYDVTEHVGGTGVVALMRNGAGPTVMLRTELDALPVHEKTGLPYASTVRTKDDSGADVWVAHACGHDAHMASLIGTATIMAQTKSEWHGTLMLIAQPAEETITGAEAMIKDGLFTRFPKPDIGLALHTGNTLPAGMVGYIPGFAYAAADSLRVTIYGKGGHGAHPEATVDPIVIAARTITTLQTIIAREITPGDPSVITVGYIHGGTKNNIIPDSVEMGITVRSYSEPTREHLLSSIARIVKAEAEAGNSPKPPTIEHYETTPAVYNDPKLSERLVPVLEKALGAQNVKQVPPQMVSEDYAYYVEAGVPSFYFALGAADPVKFAEAQKDHTQLPSNHSPLYAPDVEPTLKTGVEAEVALLRSVLGGR